MRNSISESPANHFDNGLLCFGIAGGLTRMMVGNPLLIPLAPAAIGAAYIGAGLVALGLALQVASDLGERIKSLA
jgi:hypothetical protein